MAYPKYKLKKLDEYQLLQAVDLSIRLIIAGENEQDGPVAIASEVPDANKWDDIAIHSWHEGREEVELWQIKCQHEDLKDVDFKDILISARDLLNKNPSYSFRFGLPALGGIRLAGENDLQLRLLAELCNVCQGGGNPHQTFAADPTRVPRHLHVWFEFICTVTGNSTIAATLLSRMRVEEIGSADSIRTKIESRLAQWYADPCAARNSIERAFDNANSFSLIRYDDFARELQAVPRTGTHPPWTSFRLNGNTWWQRGTISGSDTVRNAWEPAARAEIRLWEPVINSGSMTPSLLRLALHANHGVTVACVDRDGWRDCAMRLTGGTLGDDEQNRVDAIFPESCKRPLPPPLPPVNGQPQQTRSLGDALDDQMHDVTWKRVSESVDSKLLTLSTDKSFNAEAWTAWQEIKKCIEPPVIGRAFLHKLLRARFEPPNILGEIRCGPRTAEAMAQVLVLCVALRLAFRERFNIVNGIAQIDDIPVTAIALKKCRDPDDKHVVPILYHIDKIAFSDCVLLMGGLEMPSESIVCALQLATGDSFAEPAAPSFTSNPRVPDVIVSWSQDLQVALGMGKAALFKWLNNRVSRAHERQREKLTNILNAIHTEES